MERQYEAAVSPVKQQAAVGRGATGSSNSSGSASAGNHQVWTDYRESKERKAFLQYRREVAGEAAVKLKHDGADGSVGFGVSPKDLQKSFASAIHA